MRRCLDIIAIDGTIVIGEGERDKAPMLYIGEKLGAAKDQAGALTVDIAVDPLEGTNLCSTGAGGAITVLAAAERGGLLHAPDCYMEKIIVGPAAKGAVDLDAPVKHNLKAIARRLQRGVDDLVVVVLDRPRHQQLIADIREAGARIRLISDGDLSAGIAAAVAGTGVRAVMGSGWCSEGVLTAAALRCLNGEILGRLVVKTSRSAAHACHGNSGCQQDLCRRSWRPRPPDCLCRKRRYRRQSAERRALFGDGTRTRPRWCATAIRRGCGLSIRCIWRIGRT
jgi:fructose-1,6-bisphosphatase II